jgi:integrase
VRNIHGSVLVPIVRHGVQRMRLRPDDPTAGLELPQGTQDRRQVRFFQHGEWALLRACLRPDVHDMVDTLLATGVRWGEVSAIRVGDLVVQDDQTLSIHIQRAWSVRATDDTTAIDTAAGENTRWRLDLPKSRRTRWVVVTGDLAERLIARAEGINRDGYLFVTSRANPWRYPEFHSDRWRPAVTDAVTRGLPRRMTPHMLRHTTVVWALAEGVPLQVVSHMIGHASIQITYDTYGGLINLHDPEMPRAMSAAMLVSRQAIVPAPTPDEVVARPIRPGSREGRRTRSG